MSFTAFGFVLFVAGAMLWVATLETVGYLTMGYGLGFASAGYYVRRRML